jgi:beta-galactosidase
MLRGVGFANTVQPLSTEARVLATIDNAPAIVASRYGAGETLFIGAFIGAGTHQANITPDLGTTTTETVNTGMPSAGAFVMPRSNTDFILGLIDWAKIERPVSTDVDGLTNPPLVARIHETDGGYLLFLINYNADATDVTVEIRVDGDRDWLLRELSTDDRQTTSSPDSKISLKTLVDGRGAQTWDIRRAD